MKLLAMFTVCVCVVSAQDSGLKARELFYTPPPDAAPKAESTKPPAKKTITTRPPLTRNGTHEPTMANVANVPLGLRYSVMKRDAAGKFAEVDADSRFRSGDRIRIHVDTNTAGYLYVVMQGSSGTWSLLFPSSDVDGGSNRIEKGSSQQIPAGEKGQFLFDEQAGTEKLFLVLSRRPEPDLDKLIYSINGSINGGASAANRTLMAKASVGDDIVNRLRGEVKSRDLVFEKVDEQTGAGEPKEKATYVVNPSRTDEARLVVDVSLKHGK